MGELSSENNCREGRKIIQLLHEYNSSWVIKQYQLTLKLVCLNIIFSFSPTQQGFSSHPPLNIEQNRPYGTHCIHFNRNDHVPCSKQNISNVCIYYSLRSENWFMPIV
ncbi:hypothetical protein GDO86_008471 [Hymenochirus boettgeri]|uniref:Uncharacterized protein n=1 Tax=Hymenochirus boettgeri TaxID=247094 RepID=A0A8T2J267_9PIPI|nr:hypothetical protein GDO86_008471 [Hymenochirus boettgeri]